MDDYGIPIGKLFFIGLLSIVLLVDVVMGLQVLYFWQLDRVETSEDLYRPPAKLVDLLTAQRTKLTEYCIVDADQDIMSIPIDRAMELVVVELSKENRHEDP